MTDRFRDIFCSVFFLLFGVAMFIMSLPIMPIMGKDLGSGFVPKIIAGAIIVIALFKLALTVFSHKEAKKLESDDDKMGGLLTVAALLVYVTIFKPAGFILSTALYLFVQITVLSDERNRKLPLFAAISVVAPVLIYALFVYVIKMPLPAGFISF